MTSATIVGHRALRHQPGHGAEAYLTFVDPTGSGDLFAAAAAHLHDDGLVLLAERIFAPQAVWAALGRQRSAAYGRLDDGVAPTWLAPPAAGPAPDLQALQVHAVRGPVEVLGPHGRRAGTAGAGVVSITGLAGAGFDDLAGQLQRAGTALDHTARTWLWLDPIHAGYAALNQERRRCFTAHGLLAADGAPRHLPASTGIGLRPAKPGLALEALAPWGGPRPRPLQAAGHQDSALKYGSAFSRALRCTTPWGITGYVSGTAAIDAHGATEATDDPAAQVRLTIAHVRAVLADLGVGDEAIVQGMAYARDEDVLATWHHEDPGWPLVPLVADVCRPDLAFEIEVTVWCPALLGTSA